MDGCRDHALGARQQFALGDLLAPLHHRLRSGANVLLQRNMQQRRQRQVFDRASSGEPLAIVWVNATADAKQFHGRFPLRQ